MLALSHHCFAFCLQSGEPITFYWRFAGIGQERCFHDDVEIPNCRSGLVVQAKDVAHDSKEHKFRVVFEDVCGNTKDAEYTYTQEGVKAVSKVSLACCNVQHVECVAGLVGHVYRRYNCSLFGLQQCGCLP